MQQRRPIRFEAIESEYAEMATQPAARSVPHDKRQRQGGRRCRQLGAKPKRTSRRDHECGAFDPKLHNGPNKWPKTARQLVNLHKFASPARHPPRRQGI
jgi:hypothetical protein